MTPLHHHTTHSSTFTLYCNCMKVLALHPFADPQPTAHVCYIPIINKPHCYVQPLYYTHPDRQKINKQPHREQPKNHLNHTIYLSNRPKTLKRLKKRSELQLRDWANCRSEFWRSAYPGANGNSEQVFVLLCRLLLEDTETMVSFSCDGCGDVITKPKLEKHLNSCRRGRFVSCIDCYTNFSGEDYKAHTSCISEVHN